MKGIIKKADIFLLIGLIALGIAFFAVAQKNVAGDASENITSGDINNNRVTDDPESKEGQSGEAIKSANDGSVAVVRAGGKVYGTYPLSDERTIEIEIAGKKNVIKIKGGSIKMQDANCHGHDCIRQGAISKQRDQIVCLPNRITITIENKNEDAKKSPDYVDAVAGS